MNTKKLIQLATCLNLIIVISLSSCNSNSVKSAANQQQDEAESVAKPIFLPKSDQTNFSISENNGKVIFGGDITFKNLSGYDISDLNIHQAQLAISYSDGDSANFEIAIVSNTKKWVKNSNTTISIGIDPFKANLQYLVLDDFKRTPSKAILNLSLTAINIDKEIPLQYEVDVLSKWKTFQVKNGLR